MSHHGTLYNMINFKAMVIFFLKINQKSQLNDFTNDNLVYPMWLVHFTQIELNK